MEKNKIIKKLSEEHNKLLNQLEEFESPMMMEVMIYSMNRIKAIDFVINLLKINNVNLDNERDKLLTLFKESPLQGLPIDMIQGIHRLQVLFYINKLLASEDKDDTSN
ncbi:hypothetical protein LCGC14_3020810 [marine sediment metagenome]|uniref:Uncharacterized protein n=1 Tax=marine sediment metagenome TaxID=412755 RepID=A0A0F8WVD9_9ZZZZ